MIQPSDYVKNTPHKLPRCRPDIPAVLAVFTAGFLLGALIVIWLL